MHPLLKPTWFTLPLLLAAAAATPPAARAAAPISLKIQQMTDSGPGCTGGGSFYPSIDAKAKLVAFTSWCDLARGQNPDGNSELFVKDTAGGRLRQLTHTTGSGGAMEPDLSADGKLIVFASELDLVAGGNPDGNTEIYLIHADGSGLAQLTHTTGGRPLGFAGNSHPIFDPAAQHIVFSSDRDLVPGGNADGNNDLFMMNIDGSNVRQLTFTTGGWGVNQGSLDATGTHLLFDSDRDLVPGRNTDGGYEIFSMNLDGSGLVQLTDSDSSGGQAGNLFPRWTPDMQSIFFASDQDPAGTANPGPFYEVYEMNGDGTSVIQVTSCFGVFGAVPWGVALQGRALAIEADCDLVPGANLDRNGELFLYAWKPAEFPPAVPGGMARTAAAAAHVAAGARRLVVPKF